MIKWISSCSLFLIVLNHIDNPRERSDIVFMVIVLFII